MFFRKAVSPDIHLYAHRGANKHFPENTIAAFAHALKQGATHLEMDLRESKDGHLVVAHDIDAKRAANIDKAIPDCALQEIQSWDLTKHFPKSIAEKEKKDCRIATFEETLRRFPYVPINADIKDNDYRIAHKIVRLLHETGDFERVLLNSFHSKIVEYIQQIPYLGKTGITHYSALLVLLSPPLLWRAAPVRGHALQIPKSTALPFIKLPIPLDRRYLIERCHAFGVRVDYWVINDPEEAYALLKAGADGIVTDDIDALKDAVFDFVKHSERQLAKHDI